MAPTPRGLALAGVTVIAALALAALVMTLGPAAAESIDLYEFESITTTHGANAVSVRADGAEAVVLTSMANNTTTSYYDNYVYTTTGSSLSQRAVFYNQYWYWTCADHDPVSDLALMGGTRGMLYSYDGSSVRQVTGVPYDLRDIEWHPTDRVAYIATSSSVIYQYRSGSVSTFKYTSYSVDDIDVRPDGGEMVIAQYNRIEVYNITRGDSDIYQYPVDDQQIEYYYVYSAEYSLDGSYFISNWMDYRNSRAMFRFVNNELKYITSTTNQVDEIIFENEGTFALLAMPNNLNYLMGARASPVPDWFETSSTGVNDVDLNTRDFYFLVGTPEGVWKMQRKANIKPWLEKPIADVDFNEDDPNGGDNLVDLSLYVKDDRLFSKLRFEFDYQQDASLVKGTVDGQYLDFTQMVANWNGKMSFRLKVWDSGADDLPGSADDLFNRTNMFNVTVRQVNDPVTFVSLGDKVVGEDDLVWFADEGEVLNLTIEVNDVDNLDQMVQPPQFTFNYTLPSMKVDSKAMVLSFLPRNKDVGSILINLTVSDGAGSTDTLELVFHVKNVNNPPKLQGVHDMTVYEDSEVKFPIWARDEDLDIGIIDVLRFSTNRTDGVGDDDLPNFSFTVVEGDPTRIMVTFLPTNDDVGVLDVEFRVRDGSSTSSWQDVRNMRITVVNTNDAPELLEVDGISTENLVEYPLTATEDEELRVTLLAGDDDSDPLIFYVDDSRFKLTQVGMTYTATVSFTPGNDDVGNMQVTVSVWDVFNTFDELVLNITVININDPPSIVAFEAWDTTDLDQLEFTLYEDVLFTAPIVVTDIDSTEMTYSDTNGIFTFAVRADSRFAVANFTPTQADVGEITTLVEVDDGDGDVDVIVLVLTVLGTNDPPGTPTIQQLDVSTLTIPLRADLVSDADGDVLTYTWDFGDHTEKESGVDLTDVSHTYPRAGKYTVTLTVTDGHGGVSTAYYDALVPETGEEPSDTVVQEGPVLMVVVLILVFGALAGVMLMLYWKLPRGPERGH